MASIGRVSVDMAKVASERLQITVRLDKNYRTFLRFRLFVWLLSVIARICPCKVEVEVTALPAAPPQTKVDNPVATRRPTYVVPRNRRG